MMEVKQVSLFDNQEHEPTTVECLGMTFNSEDERREYFRNELRKKLPELKEIEGYPIGEDEDIIALSDPPYYTACPNPWIEVIIEEWMSGKTDETLYERKPFSSDVSEGKNDAIYNAHSYHTKVPYKAIMRYIFQYTNPGDVIYDAFCGSGMTGVAAKMCGEEKELRELGYDEKFIEKNIGHRNSILSDISPAATFISQNYNKKTSKERVEQRLNIILDELNKEESWKYATLLDVDDQIKQSIINQVNSIGVRETINKNKDLFGQINYVVWSEVYQCPSCNSEITYWESTVNQENNIEVSKKLKCNKCGSYFSKNSSQKIFVVDYDEYTKSNVRQPKLEMVKISYFNLDGKKAEKVPDEFDNKLYLNIKGKKFNNIENIAKNKFKEGSETSRLINQGIERVYDLYFSRAISIFSSLFSIEADDENLQFLFGSTLPKMTKLNRFMPQHGSRALVGPMANALYLPPLCVENNFIKQIEFQKKKIIKAFSSMQGGVITTQSSTSMSLPDNSIDYMFFDPPFGANINYSELSFARESWLKVITNDEYEAIENKKQGKTLDIYTELMLKTFKEAYRILKPNRWITVEFSNTQASVWNALQHVIQNAGFIIASVDALDKKRGGFHAMITTTAVKQDLVISAYKPSDNNILQMQKNNNNEESAWIFISQHLEKLPVFMGNKGETAVIVERTPRILFDRMIAYHIQSGLSVPISSIDFQEKVAQKYVMRDGMVFLESQVAEYDKKRILAKDFAQQSLFVSDEGSAIEWLRQQLLKKPQSRQDLHPQFMKEIQHIAKHEELPELDNLLAENFLNYTDEGTVPDQIASYLRKNYHDMRGLDNDDEKLKAKAKNRWYVPDPSKQADLEKLREKSLLREFNHYVEEVVGTKKKLKVFRTEAIRAGFKKAWSERNYQEIVEVAERLPEKVIQEDDKLLMYYDNASIRLEI